MRIGFKVGTQKSLGSKLALRIVDHPAALDSTRGSPTASKAMVKLAAVLSIFLGLSFGLPDAYGTQYLSTTGEVWTFLGFPTYGGGHLRESAYEPLFCCSSRS
jgi:hypothetical protein